MNSKNILTNIVEILKNTKMADLSDDTLEFICTFGGLSIEKQNELFEQFVNNSESCVNNSLASIEQSENTCDKNGHIYSPWYEKVSFNNYKGSSFKNKFWCKKCLKCGNVEISYVLPDELSAVNSNKVKVRRK